MHFVMDKSKNDVHLQTTTQSLLYGDVPSLESIEAPPLEIIPNMSKHPSILGKEFGDCQCGRITRSNSVRFNPIH